MTSTNAVIPIAYYIIKLGCPRSFTESTHFREDREKIKKWLTISLLKRSFSGTPDSVLRPIREIIKKEQTGYPFESIVKQFIGTNKSIEFTEADIENCLLYEYGDPYAFSVLSLLYPTLDFRNRFHQDHIHPKYLFRKPELRKRGIPETSWEKYQELCNRIGNLQLMEGLPNEEKATKDFVTWLVEKFPEADERHEYMKKNFIPENCNLGFDHFPEFLNARADLIR